MASKSEQQTKPKRLRGGTNGTVATQRFRLYAAAHFRVSEAMKAGFYLEAIALCESMIADRIEARIQFLKRDDPSKHFIDTLGNRLKYWQDIEEVELEYVEELASRISTWVQERNRALHEFVKLAEHTYGLSEKDRLRTAKSAAMCGKALVREMSSFVRRHNRWNRVTQT